MTRGLYAAAAAMLADMQRQDLVANNLANVDTPGFKRDQPIRMSFADELATLGAADGAAPWGSRLTTSIVDMAQGDIVRTDAPLDLALDGEGFFVVDGPGGELLTRNGRFTLSRDGELVTQSGRKVLGEKGPLNVAGGPVEVDEAGNVYVSGQLVDRLRIVVPTDPAELVKAGDGMMAAGAAPANGGARVVQGHYERSNVVAVRELADMMRTLRRFEASQKALTAQDASLERLIRAATGR